ncbi:hypothetical protein CC1G_10202 [Coprinopsis cinerea okayama7|uniref:Uncharacterized protein n=1 Tax=Coprinopsis cinerea (strain Okayama-7 / 130 / ATCC MYA-4618 / FGSC 9003) TaxID=240176 RepID=A8PGF5_COPC7|nr:hypothetical protein CC1G_10202 [Coprinopsis cinerea okayama7\|eukprot:XP_001841205.2 hypothetical protein CC1G_10202 [Coprinopsis cinerea okayama7\
MASLALIVFLSFIFFFTGTLGRNVTGQIDDADTDINPFPFFGQSALARIAFYPPNNGNWNSQNGGDTPEKQPESVKAFKGTYTGNNMEFGGNTPRSIVIDFFVTECDVTLDGALEYRLRHAAGSRDDDFSYQVPLITYQNLSPSFHRLEIKVLPFTQERKNYVNFDYAEYTRGQGNRMSYDAEGVPAERQRGGAELAAIISGSIGGSIIIAAIILVFYFRSRSRMRAASSSVHSKVDISRSTDPEAGGSQSSSFKGWSFKRGLISFGRRPETSSHAPPVSIIHETPGNPRYSTTSSLSSKQPMYQEFGNAENWEDLTSLAASNTNSPAQPQRHLITSFGTTQASSELEGRRRHSDNRLDSLGLHLANMRTPKTPAAATPKSERMSRLWRLLSIESTNTLIKHTRRPPEQV